MSEYPSQEKTRQRNALYKSRGAWHPILAAVEKKPGVWDMVAPDGQQYGQIRLVRRGTEIGYRADYITQAGETELVGHFRTLKSSAMRVHRVHLSHHADAISDGDAEQWRRQNLLRTSGQTQSPAEG